VKGLHGWMVLGVCVCVRVRMGIAIVGELSASADSGPTRLAAERVACWKLRPQSSGNPAIAGVMTKRCSKRTRYRLGILSKANASSPALHPA
jgi:hypothetical protein